MTKCYVCGKRIYPWQASFKVYNFTIVNNRIGPCSDFIGHRHRDCIDLETKIRFKMIDEGVAESQIA
jgi:hypothetical protein